MKIPYRTQRVLKRVGKVCLVLALLGVLAWFCGVIFLERYVVYTREGATLDFNLPETGFAGEVAVPPVGEGNVKIYYNEGNNSMSDSSELTQLNGYYIDTDMLVNHMDEIWPMLEPLPKGTPIMIELKAGKGTFYYTSNLPDAVQTTAVSSDRVDELIKKMHIKGFYTIAKVSSFRDYTFGNNHVLSGLPQKGTQYLWPDSGGCYWLNPTNASALDYLCSIVKELKSMGFNEVMLSNFQYPNTDKVTIKGDIQQNLVNAATKILEECSEDTFTVSFGVATSSFPLPEGRTRMYLENVEAQDVGKRLSQVTIAEPTIKLVFVSATNDTRFEQCGVLRPITAAEVLEAQKADQKAQEELEAQQNPQPATKPAETEPTAPPETTSPGVG